MNNRVILGAIAYLYLFGGLSYSQEASAQKAAEEILRDLASQKIKYVWTSLVSEWAHRNWPEDVFLSQSEMQSQALGSPINFTVIGRNHASHDPINNVDADIYTVLFKSTYTSGQVYENIVVVKDSDGQYRLAGRTIAPMPKE